MDYFEYVQANQQWVLTLIQIQAVSPLTDNQYVLSYKSPYHSMTFNSLVPGKFE